MIASQRELMKQQAQHSIESSLSSKAKMVLTTWTVDEHGNMSRTLYRSD